jgi:hypothetical protein
VVAVAANSLGKIALTVERTMIAYEESELREAWRAVFTRSLRSDAGFEFFDLDDGFVSVPQSSGLKA